MERENKKVSIVYILTGVILLLIIYLVLFIYRTFATEELPDDDTSSVTTLPEVASSCTFDMTMTEFNDIANNTSICGALNKINLTDVIINGQTLDATIYYSGNSDESDTGVYINNAEIASTASATEVHKFGIFDNMLFMTTVNENSANFEVFDENMSIIYSLADALNSLQIEDPAFVSLASTNSSINTILSTEYVDGNSFSFTTGQIMFNSTIKTTCTSGSYSGSSYVITYSGSIFESPTYTTSVICQ